MNQKLYRLEKIRLIRQDVSYPIATEQAFNYVHEEEKKETALLKNGELSQCSFSSLFQSHWGALNWFPLLCRPN